MLETTLTEKPAELPDEWVSTTLGEIADTSRRRAKPQDFPELPYIGMDNIESESMRLLGVRKAGEMRSSSEVFEPDDVLYGRLRPYLNKVYRPDFAGLCSAEFIVFRKTPQVASRYLQYFLNQWSFVSWINRLNTGDRPRVKFEQMASYPFPLAPIGEQRRIVDEIEKQFTRLDTAVAALERVQANLARYKASVLKAACEGRLVEQREGDESAEILLARISAERRRRWEAQEWQKHVARAQKKVAQARRKAAGQPYYLREIPEDEWQAVPESAYRRYLPKGEKWKEKYKEPVGVDSAEMPDLPPGWVWASAETITSRITDGEHITPPRTESGVYLLSARNVQNGWLSLDKVDYVSRDTYKSLALRLEVQQGDVLMSCSGTVGRSCVAPDLKFALVRSVAVLKPYFDMGAFLSYAIRSPLLQSQIDQKKTQTAQANIFQGKIKQLVFPVPPLKEQTRIVAEVERRLSVVAAVESVVATNLARAARLRQSILQRAFMGKLAISEEA